MAMEELMHITSCRKCGEPKVITAAVSKGKRGRHGEVLIKLVHRCPEHGREKGTLVPLGLIEEGRHFIKENLFRCKRCGGHCDIVDTKPDGGHVIFKIRCPDHGTGKRKISQLVFDMIMDERPPHHPPPHPHDPHAPPHDPHDPHRPHPPHDPHHPRPGFCPSCGAKNPDPDSKFCAHCGAPL